MAWLKCGGYNVISLDAYLEDRRRQHRLPPPWSVVITIDEGYADNHRLALPVLRRYRFTGQVFLVSRYIGQANEWDRGKSPALAGLLAADTASKSWRCARPASVSGVHTRSYLALTVLPPALNSAQDD